MLKLLTKMDGLQIGLVIPGVGVTQIAVIAKLVTGHQLLLLQ